MNNAENRAELSQRERLDGRVALVTGASGLIGDAIALDLAMRGAMVVAGYGCNEEGAIRLKTRIEHSGGACELQQVDLRDPASGGGMIAHILEMYKRLDIYIASAGCTLKQSAILTSAESSGDMLAVNLLSATEVARTAFRAMMRQRWGRVLMIGSRAGAVGLPGQAMYAATKGGLHAWVKSVAGEVGKSGITVNAVAPGAVLDESGNLYSLEEEALVTERIGLGRLASPEEIAAVVGFLSTPAASYVSGTVVEVDGAARF